MKKIIAKMLKRVLPTRLYRLCANGWYIVPSYYKGFIQEAERNFSFILEESSGKDILLARKYGHILDKGLQRPDVEPGHSRAFYKALVEKVCRLERDGCGQEPTVLWMKQKISEYEKLQELGKTGREYSSSIQSEHRCDYERLLNVIKGRRSNRQFLTKTIEMDVVNKMLSVVDWAASSCNKQPVKVFYEGDSTKVPACLKCCAGGTGFSDYVPLFLAFTADIRGYVWPSEIMLPFIDVSLGAQNLFLAAHTLGVSGTILSWAQKTKEQEDRLRSLLNIPENHQIVFCAVMGYAAYDYEAPARKELR